MLAVGHGPVSLSAKESIIQSDPHSELSQNMTAWEMASDQKLSSVISPSASLLYHWDCKLARLIARLSASRLDEGEGEGDWQEEHSVANP